MKKKIFFRNLDFFPKYCFLVYVSCEVGQVRSKNPHEVADVLTILVRSDYPNKLPVALASIVLANYPNKLPGVLTTIVRSNYPNKLPGCLLLL